MVISGPCQGSTLLAQERGKRMRRKRFQKGSLQVRKHGLHRVWVACWRQDGSRRCKVLGRRSQMPKGEAEAILSDILRPINSGVPQGAKPVYTFKQFVETVYLPFCRRSWKESTSGTSEQIVETHLVPEFGHCLLHAIRRRSEGSLGPEGLRHRRQPGHLHQFRPGAEAGCFEEARSRSDSEGRNRSHWREPSEVNGVNGVTRNQRGSQVGCKSLKNGAGDGIRTHDVQLGKLAFYH